MRTMTPEQLAAARRALGMNRAEMARTLRTPYRTYQDWESGKRPIPGVVAVAMDLLVEKDRWVTRTIIEQVSQGVKGALNHG